MIITIWQSLLLSAVVFTLATFQFPRNLFLSLSSMLFWIVLAFSSGSIDFYIVLSNDAYIAEHYEYSYLSILFIAMALSMFIYSLFITLQNFRK